MTKIIGISGSVRKASFNTALLRAASEVAPAGVTLEIASIREIPLYDGDFEVEHGAPSSVVALKDAIASADGLLIATPEYNNSIPGVLKNAIDWASRPPKDVARVFVDKPVGLMGATPGPGGTLLAQAAWLPVLRALGAHAWFGPRIAVTHAGKMFDAEGRLTDETLRALLTKYMTAFAKVLGA